MFFYFKILLTLDYGYPKGFDFAEAPPNGF
jgi:hypothetical protein